jgi:DNA polymerase III subunit delta'
MRRVEVPDQPLAERALRAALAREHPPQQLLLYGPPGTGKRAAARRLAWALMDPEGRHPETGAALDLSEVRATGALIRLEDELDPALAAIASRPAVADRRVLIIEGAERLDDKTGAPRILKTLEEPPPLSHIVLVTDRPSDLLPTIRSRCLPVPFRTPGWRVVARRLEERGLSPEEAAGRARADGTEALRAGPFEVEMRRLGVELGLGALAGGASPARRVREIQGRIEAAAADAPSDALLALRAEAEALAGKRGGRTAAKRAEDQEKRERRRLVTDGWALALGGAEGVVADALALAVGAPAAVRHRDRVEELAAHAAPERAPFLERALEELQATRGELPLNPDTALAMEALLGRIEAARTGRPGPRATPGRLPA